MSTTFEDELRERLHTTTPGPYVGLDPAAVMAAGERVTRRRRRTRLGVAAVAVALVVVGVGGRAALSHHGDPPRPATSAGASTVAVTVDGEDLDVRISLGPAPLTATLVQASGHVVDRAELSGRGDDAVVLHTGALADVVVVPTPTRLVSGFRGGEAATLGTSDAPTRVTAPSTGYDVLTLPKPLDTKIVSLDWTDAFGHCRGESVGSETFGSFDVVDLGMVHVWTRSDGAVGLSTCGVTYAVPPTTRADAVRVGAFELAPVVAADGRSRTPLRGVAFGAVATTGTVVLLTLTDGQTVRAETSRLGDGRSAFVAELPVGPDGRAVTPATVTWTTAGGTVTRPAVTQ